MAKVEIESLFVVFLPAIIGENDLFYTTKEEGQKFIDETDTISKEMKKFWKVLLFAEWLKKVKGEYYDYGRADADGHDYSKV